MGDISRARSCEEYSSGTGGMAYCWRALSNAYLQPERMGLLKATLVDILEWISFFPAHIDLGHIRIEACVGEWYSIKIPVAIIGLNVSRLGTDDKRYKKELQLDDEGSKLLVR
jgi:hypothetical protein